MKIRVIFDEAVKYTESADFYYQRESDNRVFDNTGQELRNIIEKNYCTDSTHYLGFDFDAEYFEFELFPEFIS